MAEPKAEHRSEHRGRLAEPELAAALEGAPNWAEVGGSIQRTVSFKDFKESMSFVVHVATEAERVQHHPDILIRYNKVTLTLSTHDAGGLTEKDFGLARTIDALVEREGAAV